MKNIKDFIKEELDKKDTVTFDIPLLIRILEYSREDLKSDVELHKMVERLLKMRNKGPLSMDDYNQIVKKRINEDGAVGGGSVGPTNVAGTGAVAGIGQPPGSKSGEPGVNMKKKKTPVMFGVYRRKKVN